MAANSGWQLLTFAARAVAGLGVVVLVARAGGPRSLGVFQFALTLTAMLPFYYGVPSLLAREVARRPAEGRRWVEAGTLISLIAGGFFTLVFAVGAIVVHASHETVVAVQLAGVGMAFDGIARVQFAAFWAWERLRTEALITSVQEATFLIGTAVVLGTGGGVLGAMIAFTGSRALGAGLGWVLVGRRLGALPVPRAEARFLRTTVRRCTPFAVSDTLTLTYMRADSVMLGVIHGPVAVGLYQAGTNLVLYFNVLARSVNHALYPRMSKAWPGRLGDFRRLRYASFSTIGLIAMPVTVACLLLAPRTFQFLYGPRFDRAILTYQLLVLVIPVRMLGHTLSLSLAAADRQTRRTVAVTAVAVLNVALNLYVIPRWSYLGAAVTTIICETLLFLLYALFLRQVAGRSDIVRAMVLPGVATVPMAAAILVTNGQHLLVSVLTGAATYAVTLVGLALARAPRDTGRVRPMQAMMNLVRGTS
ncbi:MAG: flippase [Actinomycetes bacterium]